MILPPIRFAPCLIVLLLSCNVDAQTESPDVMYDAGFSNEERLKDKTWRWMDEEGVVKLKNAPVDMVLKIKGRVPEDLMLPEPPIMKVFLNGEQLEQFSGSAKVFEKEYKVPAAKLGNGQWSDLKITTNKVIVPSQVNKKSKDDRRLGFKLYALSWLTTAGTPVPGPPEPRPAMEAAAPAKGWLAAIILAGLVLTVLFALAVGAWLYLRQRGADNARSP